MSKTHAYGDQFSTLYVRKVGAKWAVIWRTKQGEWSTLGQHKTFKDAQADALALLKN